MINDCEYGVEIHKRYNGKLTLAVDIGANTGYFTERYLDLFDHVIGFEPNNEMYQYHALLSRRSYTFYPVALSDQKTNLTYYKVENAAGISGFHLEYTRMHTDRPVSPITMQTDTLDSYNLSPDFIKIDVEGHSLQVLYGAKNTIQKYKPTIQIEQGQEFELMKSWGYTRIDVPSDATDNIYIHEANIDD